MGTKECKNHAPDSLLQRIRSSEKTPADSGRPTDWVLKNLWASMNLWEVTPRSTAKSRLDCYPGRFSNDLFRSPKDPRCLPNDLLRSPKDLLRSPNDLLRSLNCQLRLQNDPFRLPNDRGRWRGGTGRGGCDRGRFGGYALGFGGGGVAVEPPAFWLPIRLARRPRSFSVSAWVLPRSPSTVETAPVATV
jgi:hypothetical protein